MEKRRFVFQIEGPGLSPEALTLRDLVGILGDFERAAAITAKADGATESDELDFNVTGVNDGSLRVEIAASPKMYRATAMVSEAIAKGDFSCLPPDARKCLRNLSRKSRTRQWTFSICSPDDSFVESHIAPEQELLSPGEIAGGTSLLAKVDRVGGESEPTARLVLMDGTPFTAHVAGRELATRLGGLLFQILSLEGEAVWDIDRWNLKEFTITGIGEFEDRSAVEAFRNLSDVSGDYWDDIDPVEYVRQIRAD
jgi:hypothetical protein